MLRAVQFLKRGGRMKEDQAQPWGTLVMVSLRWVAVCLAAAVLFVGLSFPAKAEEFIQTAALSGGQRMVIPMGRAVGIKMFSDGVMVVGLAEVPGEAGTAAPAKTCGLKQGDIITHINETEVDTIEEVRDVLQELEGEKMSIRAMRGDKQVQLTAQAVHCEDGSYRLGAWIRDSMAGIGTITFYDPTSGLFGALGHGINDMDTALLMPLETGSIMYASVSDVRKGEAGSPGELHGIFQVNRDLGELFANTSSGIFGTLTDQSLAEGLKPVAVSNRNEVKVGNAVILSNIAGNTVEEYQVEITRIFPAGSRDTRDMMIKVTDPRLLEQTGGIVQGMSGSPIVQNGKLVGAVTHVMVNDPTQGYGILAESMLNRAGEAANANIA